MGGARCGWWAKEWVVMYEERVVGRILRDRGKQTCNNEGAGETESEIQLIAQACGGRLWLLLPQSWLAAGGAGIYR